MHAWGNAGEILCEQGGETVTGLTDETQLPGFPKGGAGDLNGSVLPHEGVQNLDTWL